MANLKNDPLLQVETTCGTLLYELQIIWDEVGESDTERDKMLLELEQECLQVYRRKVDQANKCRAQLRQTIADSEAELATICSAMGERPVHIRQSDQRAGSLKEELKSITPQVEEMRKRKCERRSQFIEVVQQIQKISNEIYKSTEKVPSEVIVDETDLSLRKLEELHRKLQALQKEKSDRLNQILDCSNTLSSLCLVLGMDFKHIVSEVHPSLGDTDGGKNISDNTIERLAAAIQNLREIKLQRMQKLQDLATTLLELWNLMDTPVEEQQEFQNVTCNVAAAEHELTEPNTLSVDFLTYVEAEVCRLEELKSSKMKELVLKKKAELEEISRKTHLVPEADNAIEYALEAIESGVVDPACILEQIELQVGKVKEEALSRKEILEKVEKWSAACEEECWLEEYNRDENRYNAGRGAHLTLKRAEKARALVNKLPAMVEGLASKTLAWEKERGIEFTYDGIRLLSMFEEYTILREEKEQERRRQRDQKKLQGQLIAEQEVLYGSKPSPSKPQSIKKAPRMSTGGASNRRISLGGAMLNTPKPVSVPSSRPTTPHSRPAKKIDRLLLLQNDETHYHDNGIAGLSAARRGSDLAGGPAKKNFFAATNACETVPPVNRKPFSLISCTTSSKGGSNSANLAEDQNIPTQTMETQQRTLLSSNTPVTTTPCKTISALELENTTPKAMPIPMPPTPKTVSAPMQTAVTPAAFGCKIEEEIDGETEYSFEERRAGFVLPKAQIKRIIPV